MKDYDDESSKTAIVGTVKHIGGVCGSQWGCRCEQKEVNNVQ